MMNYSKITSVKKDIFFKFFNVCVLFQLHQYNCQATGTGTGTGAWEMGNGK